MPPDCRPHETGLIRDRAGERAAAMAEQLAVGQIPPGRRAVVGQEHRGAAVRSDVNRARDELLAGAALAGDEHRQIVALQPLDLLDDARHGGARRQEPRQQRLERAVRGRTDRAGGSVARRAERESLPRDGRDHPQPAHHGMADRSRRGEQRRSAIRRDRDRAARRTPCRGRRAGRGTPTAPACAPCRRHTRPERARAHRRSVSSTKTTAASPADASSSAAAVSRPSSSGSAAASTIAADDRIVGVRRRDDSTRPVPILVRRSRAARVSARSRSAPSCSKTASGLIEMTLRHRARAGHGDEAAEREMAERRLIAFAKQIEQRRALREVVIRVGGAAAFRACSAPRSRRYSPQVGRRDARVEDVGGRREALLRFRQPAGRGQRFGRDQRRLQRVERRRAGARASRRRATSASSSAPLPQREPGAEHPHRPFVPMARLASVGAVRLAGAAEELAGHVVAAANQMNLRERVEHGAGRLVELNRAAHVERAVQRLLGAGEIAETDADLPERGERHREAVTRPVRLVQRHAALGQRERLLVAVLEHHHVRLVAAHGRQHVVGLHHRREPLGLPERRHRLVVPRRAARARCSRASARARDDGDRRRRAAPTPPW